MDQLIKELLEDDRHNLEMTGQRIRDELAYDLELMRKLQKQIDHRSSEVTRIEATIRGIDKLLEESSEDE